MTKQKETVPTQHQQRSLAMIVQQILGSKPTSGVITILPEANVADAAKLLSEKRIGAIVVSADGQHPLGILSERDIVRELGRRGALVLDEKVSALMTAKLITCAVSDNAVEVITKMTDGRFRHMPVMSDGLMIGLISIGDLVKARLNQLSMERDALEGMIMGT
jgi:CBS domain-containing protein